MADVCGRQANARCAGKRARQRRKPIQGVAVIQRVSNTRTRIPYTEGGSGLVGGRTECLRQRNVLGVLN